MFFIDYNLKFTIFIDFRLSIDILFINIDFLYILLIFRNRGRREGSDSFVRIS